jgi:hypothetical protein
MHGSFTASKVSALRKLQPQANLMWTNTTPVHAEADGATNERTALLNSDADKWMHQFSLIQSHRDLHQDNRTGTRKEAR